MSLGFTAHAGNTLGRHNAAAATAYYAVVPGKERNYTRVAKFSMTSGNTANEGYILRPIGRAELAADAAASQADVVVNAHPYPTGNTIASGDQVVMRQDDGT